MRCWYATWWIEFARDYSELFRQKRNSCNFSTAWGLRKGKRIRSQPSGCSCGIPVKMLIWYFDLVLCSYLNMFELFMYCDVAVSTPDELTYTALVMITIYIFAEIRLCSLISAVGSSQINWSLEIKLASHLWDSYMQCTFIWTEIMYLESYHDTTYLHW